MTNKDAIYILSGLKRSLNEYCGLNTNGQKAFDMAISALQAQDSKTRKICDTCKHDPPSKKWPCADCDMRDPADRWEPKDVSDINDGDMISRQAAIDAILAVTGNSSVRELYEHVQEHGLSDMWSGGVNAAIDIIIAVPSAQPKPCEDAVSRADVLESFADLYDTFEDCSKGIINELHRKFEDLRTLPSVTLKAEQPEIIYCKDCKHYKAYEYTGRLACHYVIGGTVVRKPDDFCSRAERITDE